jgi:regulator of sirC expression with transglutaminase-like and TPR domain
MTDHSFRDILLNTSDRLPRAALTLSKSIAYPDLDIEVYLKQLEVLVEKAGESRPASASRQEQAVALADYLFSEAAFSGNTANYWDPRNSFLNDVLDRRLGIPITLSVVYIEIANQLGIPAYGVGLPGHFIVGVQDEPGPIYLDPFHGGTRLSMEDCADLVRTTTSYQGDLQPDWLQPVAPLEIIIRMLNNLRFVFIEHESWPEAIKVVEHLCLLRADLSTLKRDLGLLHYRDGALKKALTYLDEYLSREPEASDVPDVRRCLNHVARELARLN